jgi:hypothetical protein
MARPVDDPAVGVVLGNPEYVTEVLYPAFMLCEAAIIKLAPPID